MKKAISLFLALALCLVMLPMSALAAGEITSGTCGDDVTWTLEGTGDGYKLTIRGAGEMDDFSSTNVPWSAYRAQIETVEIEEGVTKIGNNAFYQCGSLTRLTIANTVTSIGTEAFAGCTGLTSITIPESVRDIGEFTFAGCTGLQEIRFEGDVPGIGPWAFENVPETAIGYYPANNESWARLFENGTAPFITWKAYCKDDQHIGIADWSHDENQHWHKCSNPDCNAKVDEAAHDYGDQGDTCACGYERAHVHRLTFVEGKEATCTEEGLLEHYACSGCGKTFADENGERELETVTISKKDHNTVLQGEKEATCTEEGYTGDMVCTVCQQTIEQGETISVSDHNYVDGTCTACGEKDPDYQVPSVPVTPAKPIWQAWLDQWLGAIGQKCRHTYTEEVTPPTCEEKGYTTHTCTKCGHTYQDTYTEALGHNYENGVCTNCGEQQPASVPSTPVKPGWWPNWRPSWWK